MPWDGEVANPIEEFSRVRAELGDTFAIEAPDTTYLFLFSPAGVQAFYAVEEAVASKGIADWQMLRRKLPDELFLDRRTFPHDLFARDDVAAYLDLVRDVLATTRAELGDDGDFDVFSFTRRLGHRIGLTTWAGPCGQPGARLDALIEALDALDGAAAFVEPGGMQEIAANGKATEYAALARAEELIAEAIAERDAEPVRFEDHFQRIVDAWAGEPNRAQGIARDVVLVHLGSMSNLFAALGWYLIDVVSRPAVLAAVRAGDRDVAERSALESLRLSQRSVMMRAVSKPCVIDDGTTQYSVERGVTLATLLPLTNTEGLDLEQWDPDRWQRRRLRADRLPAARELVTTFGHGPHTCPAQPFSLSVMTESVMDLVGHYDFTPHFASPTPVPGQIGGVARASTPCPMTYQARPSPHPSRREERRPSRELTRAELAERAARQ